MSEVTNGPLDGVRVLELAGIGPGPFVGMMLGDMGADVLRVERPVPPKEPHGPGQPFLRSRRSVIVDLRSDAGVELALELVAAADVLLEGYRPGVAERLKVGPDECLGRNPALVYARVTGWGQTGPYASTAGHDINYVAVTGALHATGPSAGPPSIPLNLVGNFGGGALYAVAGILAALTHARSTGVGQVVDAAMVDGATSLMTYVYGFHTDRIWKDEREANIIDGGRPWYSVYETADHKWMAVGALEDEFYAVFVKILLGVGPDEAPRDDPATWPDLRRRFAEAFAALPRAEHERRFAGTDACVSPVLSLTEAPYDDHMRERGILVSGEGGIQPAPAPRFSVTPSRIQRPPAMRGDGGEAALTDWGIGHVDELVNEGVVQRP